MSAITYPNPTFNAGTTAIGSQVIANFAAVTAVVNGGLDNTNFTSLTGTLTWAISTNVPAISIGSSSTAGVFSISSTGIQAAATSIVRVTSGAAQTTGDGGIYVDFTNASSTIPLVKLANAGTNAVAELTTSGALASGKAALQVTASSATVQTTGQAIVEVDSLHASSTIPLIGAKNAGTGDFVKFQDNSSNTKYQIDSTGSVVAAAEPPSGNLLYNSGFDLWQRATTFGAITAANNYVADRWYVKFTTGLGGYDCARVSGVTAGSVFGLSLKVNASSVTEMSLIQTLENLDTLRIYNKTCSFSILVKALGNVTQVGLQFMYKTTSGKVDTTIGSEQLITVNSSTFTLGKVIAQALGTAMTTSGVVGIRIRPTAVSSGGVFDANNGFVVEQAMMNVGNVPGTFQRRFNSAQGEVAACQRFYQKSYDLATAPTTATSAGSSRVIAGSSSARVCISVLFPVRMRTAPTVQFYSTSDGASAFFRNTTAAANVAGFTGTVGEGAFIIQSNASAVLDNIYECQWTADAEI